MNCCSKVQNVMYGWMIDRVKPQPVRHGDGTRENKTKIKIFYCEAATVCTVNNEADINLQWTVTHAALFPVNFPLTMNHLIDT